VGVQFFSIGFTQNVKLPFFLWLYPSYFPKGTKANLFTPSTPSSLATTKMPILWISQQSNGVRVHSLGFFDKVC
jgi:hypothetical protein